jgi:hypothetical protein
VVFSGASNVVEVVDLSRESTLCPDLPVFPVKIRYAAASSYRNTLFSCGGESTQGQCYLLVEDKWKKVCIFIFTSPIYIIWATMGYLGLP